MRNFAITAMGRSGTKFLAELMNKSKVWTVKHEPKGDVAKRFQKDLYGEVNSFLRDDFENVDAQIKGVIVRNPYDIFLSTQNWKRLPPVSLDHVVNSLRVVQFIAYSGCKVVRFEEMTSDKEYVMEAMRYFGVEDVIVSDSDLKRKANKGPGDKKWGDLDSGLRKSAERDLRWFADAFGYDRR